MLRSWKVASAAGLYDYLSDHKPPANELAADRDYRVCIQSEAWGGGSTLMAFDRGRNKGRRLADVGMSRYTFNSLAKGVSPCRGDRLVQTQGGKHTPGFDHQFSPPKSVSIEAAFNETHRAGILSAHQKAVRAAFNTMEQNALVCRVPIASPTNVPLRKRLFGRLKGESTRTQGSLTRHVPGKLIAYVATHWTSRPTPETLARGYQGDPQLHTHVFVFNMAFAEGKWRAVDHRGLVNAVTLSESVYQNHLAHELTRLGYQLEPTTDRQGRPTFELAGSHGPTRDFFSSRHRQVQQKIRTFRQGAGREPSIAETKELVNAFYERHARLPSVHERVELLRTFREGHGRAPTEHEEQQLARQGRMRKSPQRDPDHVTFASHRRALLDAGLPLPDHTRGNHFAVLRASPGERQQQVLTRALGPDGLGREDALFYRHQIHPAIWRAAIARLSPDETTALLKKLDQSRELVVVRTHATDRSADLLTTLTAVKEKERATAKRERQTAAVPVLAEPLHIAMRPPLPPLRVFRQEPTIPERPPERVPERMQEPTPEPTPVQELPRAPDKRSLQELLTELNKVKERQREEVSKQMAPRSTEELLAELNRSPAERIRRQRDRDREHDPGRGR